MGSKFLLAPRAPEESTIVVDKLEADFKNSGYLGFKKRHGADAASLARGAALEQLSCDESLKNILDAEILVRQQ